MKLTTEVQYIISIWMMDSTYLAVLTLIKLKTHRNPRTCQVGYLYKTQV